MGDAMPGANAAAGAPAAPKARTVADVMSHPVITAQPAERISSVAQRMRDQKVGSVVVVDHDDRAIGILTERDMLRLAGAGSDAATAKVSEWMTADPDTIGPAHKEFLHDFPNGAGRWASKPEGAYATIVNGEPIVLDGELQDAGLPGHVLRPNTRANGAASTS